jgi:arginase
MARGRKSAELEIYAGEKIRAVSKIKLVTLPYDSGRYQERMGRGPAHLLETGIADSLRDEKHEVEITNVFLPEGFHSEGQALAQLQRRASPIVREALEKDQRVLVLSGNCGPAALSAVSALGPRTTGVVWFDAHGDFNTPETSASGFLDGMALSILTGRCWPALAASFEGFEPVPETSIIFIGGHCFDPSEKESVARSAITHLKAVELDRLESAIEDLSTRVERLYVHLDADVLDTAEGLANSYARPGGLSSAALYAALKTLSRRVPVGVASVTSYDPECDPSDRIQPIIRQAASILMG